jgi:hypothetical protein
MGLGYDVLYGTVYEHDELRYSLGVQYNAPLNPYLLFNLF